MGSVDAFVYGGFDRARRYLILVLRKDAHRAFSLLQWLSNHIRLRFPEGRYVLRIIFPFSGWKPECEQRVNKDLGAALKWLKRKMGRPANCQLWK